MASATAALITSGSDRSRPLRAPARRGGLGDGGSLDAPPPARGSRLGLGSRPSGTCLTISVDELRARLRSSLGCLLRCLGCGLICHRLASIRPPCSPRAAPARRRRPRRAGRATAARPSGRARAWGTGRGRSARCGRASAAWPAARSAAACWCRRRGTGRREPQGAGTGIGRGVVVLGGVGGVPGGDQAPAEVGGGDVLRVDGGLVRAVVVRGGRGVAGGDVRPVVPLRAHLAGLRGAAGAGVGVAERLVRLGPRSRRTGRRGRT